MVWAKASKRDVAVGVSGVSEPRARARSTSGACPARMLMLWTAQC